MPYFLGTRKKLVIYIADDLRFYGVIDRSGESYAYPKKLFEIVSLDN